jgi:hypothetical protein
VALAQAPTSATLLIVALAVAMPAAATPTPTVASKLDDRIEAASRAWVCPFAGSITVVSNITPRVDLDTGELVSALPPRTPISEETPFPADARDLQDWIGVGAIPD